jgi:tripartite-type tricarboxylate transporter receptor subunit TctC
MKFIKLLALVIALGTSAAWAQGYPSKPVRMIVPFPPGGATDIVARIVGQKLSEVWGQSVLIENRSGAGGNIAAIEAAKSAPDGYTLFFPSGSVVTANEHIYKNSPVNPERDFVAVTNCATGPQVLVVPTSSPYKTTSDLIAAAKAQPGKLSFGSAGIGSQGHLATEYLVYTAGVDAVHVPYKGEGPALNDLIAGQTQFMVTNLAAAVGFINQGRLRALGVTSKVRASQVPDVPTIAETLPGFESAGWFGIVAPAGTPRNIVDKIYRDTAKVMDTTELRARLYVLGMVPVGDSPENFAEYMKAERLRWGKVVSERKIEMR